MNAIDFLIKEHNQVRRMLAEISDKSHRYTTRKRLLGEVSNQLLRHETMEHETWYPHFRHDKRLTNEVQHLLGEEKDAKKFIKRFDHILTEEEWEKAFAKFKKDVEHHAHEEEQKLFPQVRKLLDETTLKEIGRDMQVFKKKYNAT